MDALGNSSAPDLLPQNYRIKRQSVGRTVKHRVLSDSENDAIDAIVL